MGAPAGDLVCHVHASGCVACAQNFPSDWVCAYARGVVSSCASGPVFAEKVHKTAQNWRVPRAARRGRRATCRPNRQSLGECFAQTNGPGRLHLTRGPGASRSGFGPGNVEKAQNRFGGRIFGDGSRRAWQGVQSRCRAAGRSCSSRHDAHDAPVGMHVARRGRRCRRRARAALRAAKSERK